MYQIEGLFRKHMFFDFCSLPARFWISFGSKMGGVLLLKAASKALPSPSWTSKAIWTSTGAILEAIWNDFWLEKIDEKQCSQGMGIRI